MLEKGLDPRTRLDPRVGRTRWDSARTVGLSRIDRWGGDAIRSGQTIGTDGLTTTDLSYG